MKKLVIVLVIIAGVIGATFLVKPRVSRAPTERPEIADSQSSAGQDRVVTENYVKYPGKDGKDAFSLLQETTNVEFKKYDFGVFVQSIRGVKPDEKHFWKLYINGQESQVGADQVKTVDDDVIEWKLEEIKQ